MIIRPTLSASALIVLVVFLIPEAFGHAYPDTVRVRVGETTTFHVSDDYDCAAEVWIDHVRDPDLVQFTPMQGFGIDVEFTVMAGPTAGVTVITVQWVGEHVGQDEGHCREDTRFFGGVEIVIRVTPDEVNSARDASSLEPGDGHCDTGKNIDRGGREEPECTLRAAIQENNAGPGGDRITFDIPGAGPHAIQAQRPLPVLEKPVIISGPPASDARREASASDVWIDGSMAGAAADGLVIGAGAGGSTIENVAVFGFGGHGIVIRGDGATIANATIGAASPGGPGAGNGGAGVYIDGASSSTIGDEPGSTNTIVGNSGAGVMVIGESAVGNRIRRNRIVGNGALGIDLFPAGPNPNDDWQVDGGPNRWQNYPRLDSARVPRPLVPGASVTVMGTLEARPNASYDIDLFLNDDCDASGFGQGQTFVESTVATTGSDGEATFSITFTSAGDVLYHPSKWLTTTATDSDGNTSEFSRCWRPHIVNSVTDAANAVAGETCDTGNTIVRNGEPEPECTLRAAIEASNAGGKGATIRFDIPGTGAHFIRPTTELPSITAPVVIDGATQPGFDGGEPVIILAGNLAGAGASGVKIDAEGVELRSLLIRDFQLHGVRAHTPHLEFVGLHLLSNGESGVFIPNGSLLARSPAADDYALVALNNGRDGIFAPLRPVTMEGNVRINGSGAGMSTQDCVNANVSAISAGRIRITGDLELQQNCAHGLRSATNIVVAGSVNVTRSGGFGLWAVTDVTLEGQEHTVSMSGWEAIFTPGGRVVVSGRLRAQDNGRNRPAAVCSGDGTTSAILAEYGFLGEAVEITSNCGNGIYSSDFVVIRGNATVSANTGRGIWALNEIVMEGARSDVSQNGLEGLMVNNRFVRLAGAARVNDNNRTRRQASPASCLPGASGLPGGVVGQLLVDARDLEASDNCGVGVVSYQAVRIRGRAILNQNTSHGLDAGSASVTAGDVCENRGYGLLVRGGPLTLGAVNVCRNVLGGIRGATPQTAGRAEVPDPPSSIRGAAIVANEGDGVRIEAPLSLSISGSTFAENAGLAINNEVPELSIDARGNWWGDASGPGGNGPGSGQPVSGGVDFEDWRQTAIGLVLTSAADSLYLVEVATDTMVVFARDWRQTGGTISVSITEGEEWIEGPAEFQVALNDTTTTAVPLVVRIPPGAGEGSAGRVSLTAVEPGSEEDATVASFHVLNYLPVAATLVVMPDTVTLLPGESHQFIASGLDQFDREIGLTLTWTAGGGEIDAGGHYTAGATPGTYEVTATDATSGVSGQAVVHVAGDTGVDGPDGLPTESRLHGSYPNPFHPSTTIRFDAAAPVRAHLAVYDLLGRQVAVLLDEDVEAGRHSVVFDAAHLAAGIYVLQVRLGSFADARRMTLVK